MKPRSVTAVLALVATALLGSIATVPAEAAQSARVTASSTVRHLTFTVTFTSTGTTLTSLPGDVTYGWNHLVGRATWGKRSAHVDFLGQVNYVDGSGPFGGYVTLTRANGTTLGFSVSGHAMSPPVAGTENTRFSGAITVIGGAGGYAGATGIGTMSGYRKAALGSPVTLTFDLYVRP